MSEVRCVRVMKEFHTVRMCACTFILREHFAQIIRYKRLMHLITECSVETKKVVYVAMLESNEYFFF